MGGTVAAAVSAGGFDSPVTVRCWCGTGKGGEGGEGVSNC